MCFTECLPGSSRVMSCQIGLAVQSFSIMERAAHHQVDLAVHAPALNIPGTLPSDTSATICMQMAALIERVADEVHLLLGDRETLRQRESILMDILTGHYF